MSTKKADINPLKTYASGFDGILEKYKCDHPNWYAEVFVSLLKRSLVGLRQEIEDRKVKGVNWKNPLTEFVFPVEWNWNALPTENPYIIGRLTKQNAHDDEAAAETLGQMMVQHLNFEVLQWLTKEVWFQKNGEAFESLLPLEFQEIQTAIKGEAERQEFLESLFHPFSIGAATIDFDPEELVDGKPVPERIAKQLSRTDELIAIGDIGFKGEIGGKEIHVSLIFQVHPLIIDPEKKTASHALTVGLFSRPLHTGRKMIERPLWDWPNEDLNTLWENLFAEIDLLADGFIPEVEQKTSTIFKVNAEIAVSNKTLSINGVNETIQGIVDGLAKIGHLQRVEIKSQVDGKQASPSKHLLTLFSACENAITPHEKGQSLEILMAELFNTVPGFKVEKRNALTQTEEIDLVILNESQDPRLKREEVYILAECKNWSAKCGKSEFVLFREKIENRKGRSSLGFLISWNGFAETITKEMLRDSASKILVVPLGKEAINLAITTSDFEAVLLSEWDKALHT